MFIFNYRLRNFTISPLSQRSRLSDRHIVPYSIASVVGSVLVYNHSKEKTKKNNPKESDYKPNRPLYS